MRIQGLVFAIVATVAAGIGLHADAPTPSEADAKTACLTIERALVAAREINDVQDAEALMRSYEFIRRYVHDGSMIAGADNYVNASAGVISDAGNTQNVGTGQGHGGGVITWSRPYVLALPDDDVHQTGVLVYGKNGSVDNLHSTFNMDQVTRILKANGAMPAESLR